VISVDAKGELTDVLVVGYTNVVFANAAVAAFKRWTYEPARAHGKARASRVEVLVTFKNGMGVMVQSLPTSVENSLIRSLQERYSYRVCQLRDLDRIPTPLQVVPPTPPKGGLEPGAKRTVTVEFYIDENGRVRMPAIDREEPDDSYAAAAVSAVERWRFEPPVRKGRPVLVLARQDFNFVPKP
jgi:TonB family protein